MVLFFTLPPFLILFIELLLLLVQLRCCARALLQLAYAGSSWLTPAALAQKQERE
jgi:hypothetical protein